MHALYATISLDSSCGFLRSSTCLNFYQSFHYHFSVSFIAAISQHCSVLKYNSYYYSITVLCIFFFYLDMLPQIVYPNTYSALAFTFPKIELTLQCYLSKLS